MQQHPHHDHDHSFIFCVNGADLPTTHELPSSSSQTELAMKVSSLGLLNRFFVGIVLFTAKEIFAASCGGGNRGDGVCSNGRCCSKVNNCRGSLSFTNPLSLIF